MSAPTALELVLRQGFGLAILLVLPLVVAAALGSLTASLLGSLLGVQDPSVSLVARALAVLLALILLADSLGRETVGVGERLWKEIALVGKHE